MPLDASGKLRSDRWNYNDELGFTAYSGEVTGTGLSSETVRSRQRGTGRSGKQRCSADWRTSKYVAEDHVFLMPNADPFRIRDEETSSLCRNMNSAQFVGHPKHNVCRSANFRRSQNDLSVRPNSGIRDGNSFCYSKYGRHFPRVNNSVAMIPSRLRCSVCGKSFDGLLALKRHITTTHVVWSADADEKKPAEYVCSHCGRLFKTTSSLNSHVMTHTGERPVVCRVPGCGKRFTQHSTRAFHERTHSDDMPHICAVCGRRFKHATGVRIHMTVHTGYKPHRCPSCPKLFRRMCDLRSHSLVHSAERAFSCTQCQKCFKDKHTLSRHILAVHTDEIPWRCSVCDKGFKTSGNLRVHLRVHTGDKPYVCQVCGTRFSYSSSLKSHVQVHSAAAVDRQ